MGCSGAKAKSANLTIEEAARRRLTVGHVDKNGVEVQTEITEEERGLITGLNVATVLEMLSTNSSTPALGRKFSAGSLTDPGKVSFANKTMQQIGDDIDPGQFGLGYTCRKGLKPESPNQDSWSILKVDGSFSIYGVFDGHGLKGHDVSNFVKDTLPKLIIRDQRINHKEQRLDMLKEVFFKTQALVSTADRMKKLSAQMSGTTATVALHDHSDSHTLTLAHVADSTAVLGVFTDESRKELQAVKLTRDHKPNLKDEKERIEKNGGRVVFDGYANHRVYAKNAKYPGLNMSRCIGDLLGHQDCGISAEPEISQREVGPLDHVLLLCSDGVWEFVSPPEAVAVVSEFAPPHAMMAAEILAKLAWDRWIKEEGGAVVDDITVVLSFLQAARPQDAAGANGVATVAAS